MLLFPYYSNNRKNYELILEPDAVAFGKGREIQMSVRLSFSKRNCGLVIYLNSVYEKGLALQMLATFQKP